MELTLGSIMSISQEGTLKDYCDSFQMLFNQVRNLEEISEFYAIYLFICGLEPEIRKIFARWHQYSCIKVEDVISLALKIDSNGLQDSFSPFDPNSFLYNKDLEFDINITLEELMKDNELFRNGKIQETFDIVVQETFVDEVIGYVHKTIEDESIQDECSEDKLYGEMFCNNLCKDKTENDRVTMKKNSEPEILPCITNLDQENRLLRDYHVEFGEFVRIIGLTKSYSLEKKKKKQVNWEDTGWQYSPRCSSLIHGALDLNQPSRSLFTSFFDIQRDNLSQVKKVQIDTFEWKPGWQQVIQWGKTTDEEKSQSSMGSWPGVISDIKPPNSTIRLYGGAVFERVIHEFRCAAYSVQYSTVSRKKLSNITLAHTVSMDRIYFPICNSPCAETGMQNQLANMGYSSNMSRPGSVLTSFLMSSASRNELQLTWKSLVEASKYGSSSK